MQVLAAVTIAVCLIAPFVVWKGSDEMAAHTITVLAISGWLLIFGWALKELW